MRTGALRRLCAAMLRHHPPVKPERPQYIAVSFLPRSAGAGGACVCCLFPLSHTLHPSIPPHLHISTSLIRERSCLCMYVYMLCKRAPPNQDACVIESRCEERLWQFHQPLSQETGHRVHVLNRHVDPVWNSVDGLQNIMQKHQGDSTCTNMVILHMPFAPCPPPPRVTSTLPRLHSRCLISHVCDVNVVRPRLRVFPQTCCVLCP